MRFGGDGMETALSLKNVTFSYSKDGKKILDNISFDLNYGEIVLLSGESGGGKSTLLSVINGVIPFITPGELTGSVFVDGGDVTNDKISLRAEKIGSVMQNADEQIVYGKTADELAFGCENLGIAENEITERITCASAFMGLDLDSLTRTLSGGQKQRLSAACVLSMGQRIIILDEPLANLDPAGAKILLNALRKLADSGYAVLIAEHRYDIVKEYTDRRVFISDGRLSNYNAETYVKTACNEKHTVSSEPILSARGICRSFNGRKILNNIDIDIFKGERLVLTGENGCGKTTLMRILARLDKPDSGVITQNIVPRVKRFGGKSEWFNKVGYVYQNPAYQLFMQTLEEEISFKSSDGEWTRYLIASLGLSGLEKRHPQSLSEGQKRRAGIAAVCAGKPELLFLDEPTVGLDGENLGRVISLINMMNREFGCCVVTVTHDKRCMNETEDRKITIVNGSIATKTFGK